MSLFAIERLLVAVKTGCTRLQSAMQSISCVIRCVRLGIYNVTNFMEEHPRRHEDLGESVVQASALELLLHPLSRPISVRMALTLTQRLSLNQL